MPARRMFALLMIALVTAVGCKKEQAGGGNSNDNGTGDIVIGHYGSLTGSEATFGKSTDNGIKLAVQEINAKGGVNGQKIDEGARLDPGAQIRIGQTVLELRR